MASALTKRRAVAATLAAAILGITITLIQLSHLGSISWSSRLSPASNSDSSHSRDFFRLWHPPWLDPSRQGEEASVFDATKSTCKRTLLYRFAGQHGFASEYLIFIRVALLARHYSYELLVDDSNWNYGRWIDYFLPIHVPCARPRDISDGQRTSLAPVASDPPLAMIKLSEGRPAWTLAPHVIWSTRKLDYLDQAILELYANTSAIEELHRQEVASSTSLHPLTSSETIPPVYQPLFRIMSKVISGFWHLNEELQSLVESVVTSDSVSPTSRSQLIAAHVRLGDKAMELDKFSPSAFPKPRKTFQQLYDLWFLRLKQHSARHIEAPHSARQHEALLSPATSAVEANTNANQMHSPRSQGHSGASLYIQAAKGLLSDLPAAGEDESSDKSKEGAILLVISDDSSGDGLRDFLAPQVAAPMSVVMGFDGQQPSPIEANTTTKLLKSELAEDQPGFHENTFNALPLQERVAQTKQFLRDLTAVAQLADGLVFTGSSNVGRLLALLGSKRHSFEKHIVSVDVRWFPTARYQ